MGQGKSIPPIDPSMKIPQYLVSLAFRHPRQTDRAVLTIEHVPYSVVSWAAPARSAAFRADIQWLSYLTQSRQSKSQPWPSPASSTVPPAPSRRARSFPLGPADPAHTGYGGNWGKSPGTQVQQFPFAVMAAPGRRARGLTRPSTPSGTASDFAEK
jgi:hypothetical protein